MSTDYIEIGGPGIQGPPGPQWRTFTTDPDNSVGLDGDFWLKTPSGNFYKRTAGVYVLTGNIAGPPGPAGIASTITSGATVPSNPTGNNLDVFVKSDGTVYQRQSGTWQIIGNMTGPAGTPGTVWTVSTLDPDNSVGRDGDLWLKSSTGQYWKRISGTYTLVGSLIGPAGAGGSATQWLFGSSTPSIGAGGNGDFYLRSNGEVYQKSGGTWTLLQSLVGPAGPSLSVSEVADLAARDALSGGSLTVGMIVYVRSTREWYKLNSTGPSVWSRVAGQTESREWYIPATLMDDSSGVSPGDPTSHIQGWIDAASSAYNATLGRIVLVFPSGRWTADEIVLKGKVRYRVNGDTILRRRSNAAGTSNRSILRTLRRTGINASGTTQAFTSWVTSPLDMSNPDNWYGDAGDISIEGPGRLILDPSDKTCSLPHFRVTEAERMFIGPGCLEIWHGTGSNQLVWASTIGGREIHWFSPIVRGGNQSKQDGIHFTHGRNINVHGGYVASGDDAFVCQNTAAGLSTAGPDEGIADVTVVGACVDTTNARACNASAGVNWISMPWVNGGGTVKRFTCRGITGWAARLHGQALCAHVDENADGIYSYSVTGVGSGGTNGTYKCPVISGDGNGSGAFCFVTVTGGSISAAVMWWNSADSASGTDAFKIGSGYKVNGTVDLSGIPGLTGASVVAKVSTLTNDRLTDINYDVNLRQGSAAHDGTEPYTIVVKGASRMVVTGHIYTEQNGTTRIHRPFRINSGNDITIAVKYDVPVVAGAPVPFGKSGIVETSAYQGSVVDNLRFEKCNFAPSADTGGGVVKFLGPNIGNVELDRCIFRDVANGQRVVWVYDREGVSNPVDTAVRRLSVVGCRVVAASGTPSNVRFLLLGHNTGGSYGQIKNLFMAGNDFSQVTLWDSQQTFQDCVLAWRILPNDGFNAKFRRVVTVGAGATSQAFASGTHVGFPGGAADLNSACLSIVPINLPSNAGVQWACAVTGIDQATLSLSGAPGGSGQKFAVTIDCSARPVDTAAG